MSKTQSSYGGQAVLEGVMIRGKDHFSVSVRNPSGQIITRTKPVPNLLSSKLKQIPLIRGVITLAETLVLGMDALNYSSSVASGVEPEATSRLSIISMLVISLTIAIILFFTQNLEWLIEVFLAGFLLLFFNAIAIPGEVLGQNFPETMIAVIDFQTLERDALAARNIRSQMETYRSQYAAIISKEEEQLRQLEQELKRQRTILSLSLIHI